MLVDNAVEVIAKTYLSLPKRITGISISRRDLENVFESFPVVISCLEKNCSNRLDHIDLGEIEWYHSLRNKLYHDGSGLTVAKERVDVYLALASQVFEALFDERIDITPTNEPEKLLGQFMSEWAVLEKGFIRFSESVNDTYGRMPNLRAAVSALVDVGRLPGNLFNEITFLQQLRNDVVHGQVEPKEVVSTGLVTRVRALNEWLRREDPGQFK